MKKAILSIVSILAVVLGAASQNYVTPVRSDITPPTPQSAAIVAVQNPTPDLMTGAVNVSVPIYTISENGVELPISLQYHTNGIKVFDDPAPVGYGWSLMPALRATRTVMGRPDELYEFSGSPTNYDDVTEWEYMCITSPTNPSINCNERLDSEHDIFTIALPTASITRILDNNDGKMEFIGAGDDEYKVTADSKLNNITVTDPYGNKFIFGGYYEHYQEGGGKFVSTAWALKKIVTDNGDSIDLKWSTVGHPFSTRQWFGGYSFMDKKITFHWYNSGQDPYELYTDNYLEGIFSRCHESNEFLRLDEITFKGGKVNFSYTYSHIGPTLKSIDVINEDKESVCHFSLSYNKELTLLEKIDGGAGKQYSFEYNTDYGEIPFESMYGRHAQDWWGYYNAKDNESLTPNIGLKYYQCAENTDVGYIDNFGNADRSVDEDAMQALILKSVTWPTGGITTFEYEPHRFAPTRMDSNGEIDPATDPYLSVGGGLRVKKVTTSTGAPNDVPMTVNYDYPLAQVRAVPSAATFVEVNTGVLYKPNAHFWDTEPHTFMRMVNIMPVSDYMRYDIGAVPIWYDHVAEIWPEGKTETYFKDMFEDLEYNKPFVSYGKRQPNNSQIRVFNGSPVMSKQIIYRVINSTYIPVESTDYEYTRHYGHEAISSNHILRNYINVDQADYSSPDFADGRIFSQFYKIDNAYSSYDYAVCPYYWNLTRKTHTVYTDTGDSIVTTENYDYYRYTELLKSVSTTTSEGKTRSVTVDYPSSAKGGWQSQMVSANVVGVPVHEKITNGNATTDIYAEYTRTASGAFRQSRTASVYGGSVDTLYSPTCKYDRLGNLVKVTDADGLSVDWAWDSKGLYPAEKNHEGHITTFEYKGLVGLSKIKTPTGLTTLYDYDSYGRLIKSSVSGLGTLQTIDYSFSPGNNSVTSTTWLDADRSHVVRDTYDNLGRKISTADITTGLQQTFVYDEMGRCIRTSVPSTEPAASVYDYNLTSYEASPRGRVISTVKSGEAWHKGNKGVTARILTNDGAGLSCPRYEVGADGNLSYKNTYAPRTLTVEETTDENGHVTRVFTNLSGLVVMKEEGDGGSDMLRTRYVYDDYGRLRFILPPSFADGGAKTTDDEFIKNCYEYHYDSFGRLTESRVPGSTATRRLVYSKGGRIVAEHTAAMGDGNWFVNFYDKWGRKAYTSRSGLLESELDYLRSDFSVARYVGPGRSEYGGYALEPAPRIPADYPFSAAYYDTYGFRQLEGAGTIPAIMGLTTGLLTGEADYSAGSARYTAYKYDGWGRIVAQYRQTAKGLMTSDYTLDRAGNPLETATAMTVGGKTWNCAQSFGYDNAGRLTSRTVGLNGVSAGVTLTYGPTGGVATELFTNNVARKYEYDCHGWVNSITTSIPRYSQVGGGDIIIHSAVSDNFYTEAIGSGLIGEIKPSLTNDFTERILYESGVNPRWDGTASARITSLGGRYDYRFDIHDRLVRADYTPGADASEDEDFSTAYTYNAVGAPLTVVRHGVRSVATDRGERIAEGYGVMDRLSYRWNGMLLSEVTAEAGGQDFVGRTGFPLSGTGGGTASYGWNGAGLLNSDTSRGITRTTYNHLSLPTTVTFSDKSHLDYTYNAAGEVQTVTTYAMVAGAKRPVKVGQRSYCGDFVFEGDSLTEVNFAGGYFDGEGRPHFRHADWQGNVAMVTDRDGQIEQHNGYYPYGEPWREPTGQNRLFGGKERMRDDGLNDYDYVARRLNSATGIWGQPDPMAGDFAGTNPYVFCGANPIKFIDPSGCAQFFNSGGYVGNDGIDDKKKYFIPDEDKTNEGKGLPSAGLNGETRDRLNNFIKKNSGKSSAFKNSDVYDNVVEIISSKETMDEVHKVVSQDTGVTYDHGEISESNTSPANNREHGGTFTKDGKVNVLPSGKIADPEKDSHAGIEMPTDVPGFHSHPSGTKKTEKGIAYFRQTPSLEDIQNCNTVDVNYVIGRGDNNIYLYNKNGLIGTVNYNKFRGFIKKK